MFYCVQECEAQDGKGKQESELKWWNTKTLRAECHLLVLMESSAKIRRKVVSHGTDQAEGVAGDLGVGMI